jgi:hypothetical protein
MLREKLEEALFLRKQRIEPAHHGASPATPNRAGRYPIRGSQMTLL